MKIGVFIPIGNNGWLVSTTSPQYMPSWDLNREVVQKAERYGLDFALSMIKLRGFGGPSEYWDHNLESFTLMAGLAAVTSRIQLFASVAVLTLPPAIVARMAVTIDSISHGRFGVNIVSGWQKAEYEQMGLWPGEVHFERRYGILLRIRHGDEGAVGDRAFRLQGRFLQDGGLPVQPAADRADQGDLRRAERPRHAVRRRVRRLEFLQRHRAQRSLPGRDGHRPARRRTRAHRTRRRRAGPGDDHRRRDRRGGPRQMGAVQIGHRRGRAVLAGVAGECGHQGRRERHGVQHGARRDAAANAHVGAGGLLRLRRAHARRGRRAAGAGRRDAGPSTTSSSGWRISDRRSSRSCKAAPEETGRDRSPAPSSGYSAAATRPRLRGRRRPRCPPRHPRRARGAPGRHRDRLPTRRSPRSPRSCRSGCRARAPCR